MPIRKTQFVNEEYYHVIIRSVGDTQVFLNEDDYFRGIFSIYEFNNSSSTTIWLRRIQRKKEKLIEVSGISIAQADRERFVDVLAFAIMPNHIHLLVKQLKDNGISNFMKKIGGGYANYFNKKYKRKGHLFCTFQSVHIAGDSQFRNVFSYIHCNPISLIEPGFKENRVKDPKKAIEFLNNYKWSSYRDYIGVKGFPSMTQRDFILEMFGGFNGCKNEVENWIKYKSNKRSFDFDGINLE